MNAKKPYMARLYKRVLNVAYYSWFGRPKMPKSVLITGCSDGGIGHALAENLAMRGLTVFATARSTSKITGFDDYSNVYLLNLDVTLP